MLPLEVDIYFSFEEFDALEELIPVLAINSSGGDSSLNEVYKLLPLIFPSFGRVRELIH